MPRGDVIGHDQPLLDEVIQVERQAPVSGDEGPRRRPYVVGMTQGLDPGRIDGRRGDRWGSHRDAREETHVLRGCVSGGCSAPLDPTQALGFRLVALEKLGKPTFERPRRYPGGGGGLVEAQLAKPDQPGELVLPAPLLGPIRMPGSSPPRVILGAIQPTRTQAHGSYPHGSGRGR
jgi:hypothetical protein